MTNNYWLNQNVKVREYQTNTQETKTSLELASGLRLENVIHIVQIVIHWNVRWKIKLNWSRKTSYQHWHKKRISTKLHNKSKKKTWILNLRKQQIRKAKV